MIRVVADTNVYISASVKLSRIVAHDPDHRILECALAGDKKHLQHLKIFSRFPDCVSPRIPQPPPLRLPGGGHLPPAGSGERACLKRR